MKKYIFLTGDIHGMGGMQNYVRSKVEYLQEKGWQVYVLFQGSKSVGCTFPQLDAFLNGGLSTLVIPPEKIYDSLDYWTIIHEMLEIIEFSNMDECQYVIESNADYHAVWGEVLAQTIGAKHICFICNERFRGEDKHYIDYMDFFKWKYQRRELAGIADNSLKMLFDGFMDVESSPERKLVAAFRDNVCDCDSDIVDKLPKKEWNIAYFGRCDKAYFPIIVEEIGKFALKHNSREIQFVIIGDMHEQQKEMVNRLERISNLTITNTGSFSVLPKSLFARMDTIIAGSGCAVIAARQGVPTIVADAKTYQAIGVYGYTTSDFLYGEVSYSYGEILEDVLGEKKYLAQQKNAPFLDKPEDEYEKFFDFVNQSEKQQDFFAFDYETADGVAKVASWEEVRSCLDGLSKNDKGRRNFAEWFIKEYGNLPALFGVGRVGKLILDTIPELKFVKLYDNQLEVYAGREIVKPSADNLNEVDVIVLSPITQGDEIVKQLRKLGYKNVIIGFADCIKQCIKSKL